VRSACSWLALAGCGFSASLGNAPPADAPPSDVPPARSWWDPAYAHRQRIVVTTGAVRPDKGYAGYTVGVAVKAVLVPDLQPDCDDLRVAVVDGETWTEVPRHLLGCGTAELAVRFKLPVDIADTTAWRDAYLYYGNATATAPASAVGEAVYAWWDDAAADRAADYARGRMDPWLATGHDNSLAWNAAGHYTYDTGDDAQSSYRRAVDERDVLVEAEWFHTGCYQINMQSGVCARGVIASGTGGSEQADHYYCTSRAQNPSCADTDQGIYDGDIVKTDNEIIALQGMTDPPAIVPNQWRKQALAVFGAAPTQLRFWDADASWPALAMPPATALQASGSDGSGDHVQRGFAGIMTAQDIAQVRGVVIRRYVEPEPTTGLEAEESLQR